MIRAAVGNAPMRSGPVRLSRVAASAADASSSTAKMDCALSGQDGACRSESHLPAGAFEQRHAGLAFKRGKLLRDGDSV